MSERQSDEIHQIHVRLNSIIQTGKWVLGFVFVVVMAAAGAQIRMMERVASLETWRDSMAVTIDRIDRNVEDMKNYLRDLGR